MKDEKADLCRAYQDLIRERFPNAIVLPSNRVPSQSLDPSLAVHGIADAQMPEFISFMMKTLYAKAESFALPRCVIVPFSLADTKAYQPEVWTLIQHQAPEACRVETTAPAP